MLKAYKYRIYPDVDQLNTPLGQRIGPVDLFPLGKGMKQEATSSN